MFLFQTSMSLQSNETVRSVWDGAKQKASYKDMIDELNRASMRLSYAALKNSALNGESIALSQIIVKCQELKAASDLSKKLLDLAALKSQVEEKFFPKAPSGDQYRKGDYGGWFQSIQSVSNFSTLASIGVPYRPDLHTATLIYDDQRSVYAPGTTIYSLRNQPLIPAADISMSEFRPSEWFWPLPKAIPSIRRAAPEIPPKQD